MQQIPRLPHYTASDSSTRFVLLMRTDGHIHLKPAVSVLSTKISKLKFCRYCPHAAYHSLRIRTLTRTEGTACSYKGYPRLSALQSSTLPTKS
jgi:hypothetical protein